MNEIQDERYQVVEEAIYDAFFLVLREKELDKIKVLSIAPLFAEAIKRLYEHKPMGDLFEK